jgi:iron complex transport system permease protein
MNTVMNAAGESRRLEPGYRHHRVRWGPAAFTVRTRSVVVAAGLVAAIALLGTAALGLGVYPLGPDAVLGALLGGGDAVDRTVVLEWRLPRAVAAVALGALLAIAGALFQTTTRNPLASPDVLGLANGAFAGMLLTVVWFSASWPLMTAGAVAGGLATAALIWGLAHRGGGQSFRLIVIGIGVAAILASANTWMLLTIELETAMSASAWGAGSLNGVTAGAIGGALVCALPLVLALGWLAPALRQLDLGDDVARATGARPARTRAISLLIAVGLVSIATAVAGPIAFLALAAPQLARRLSGTPFLSLTMSALVGAFLLLTSDVVAQHVLPVTLPVGVVTVSVGGVYLVAILIQEIRRRA